MPFYEYQCAACGHHHEELQKINARPLRKCPDCGRATLRRLVSAPVFRLKGGGWYETDFKADKEGQRNIAGEKEPPAEKPKDDKTAAAAKEATPKTGADAGTGKTGTESKPVGVKTAPARKTRARRKARE